VPTCTDALGSNPYLKLRDRRAIVTDKTGPQSLDSELEVAIREAVVRANGSSSLAKRIIAWVQELSDGGTSLEKKQEVFEHFGNLCAAIEYEDENDDR